MYLRGVVVVMVMGMMIVVVKRARRLIVPLYSSLCLYNADLDLNFTNVSSQERGCIVCEACELANTITHKNLI